MCYTVISHLHSFWSDHHKSSHLSPCKVITILLTLFLLLHSTSLYLIYFTPENLYRLISLAYFTPFHPPPLWQPPVWTLYLSVCFYSSIVNMVKVKVPQSCLTLCDPMDYTVHGIHQARILEWVAFPFSRGSSQPRDQTQVSCIARRFPTSWTTREAQEYWSG